MKVRIINLLKIAWIPVTVSWLGALLNTVVVRANGGMPALNLEVAYNRWVPLTPQTRYPVLADVIPLFDRQCSLGDILMYFGTAIWLYIAVLYMYRVIKQSKERGFSWR
jgi:hypothetical protein